MNIAGWGLPPHRHPLRCLVLRPARPQTLAALHSVGIAANQIHAVLARMAIPVVVVHPVTYSRDAMRGPGGKTRRAKDGGRRTQEDCAAVRSTPRPHAEIKRPRAHRFGERWSKLSLSGCRSANGEKRSGFE